MDVEAGKVFKAHWLEKPQPNPMQAKFHFVWNIVFFIILAAYFFKFVIVTANFFKMIFDKLQGDYSFRNFTHVLTVETIFIFKTMLFLGLLFIVFAILGSIINFFTAEVIGVTPHEVYRKSRLIHQKIPLSDIRLVKREVTTRLMIKTNKDEFHWGKSLYCAEVDEVVAYILEKISIYHPDHYENVKTEHFEIEEFWRK